MQLRETAVLAVLAGTPIDSVATGAGMAADELAAAVATYQAAGSAALRHHPIEAGWRQIFIDFPDWRAAEHTGTDLLGPNLQQAEAKGLLTVWFFVRKAACWRLRCQPTDPTSAAQLDRYLSELLDAMKAQQQILGWTTGIYEPETHTFGGSAAMATAHRLFHADSRAILAHLKAPPGIGHGGRRTELSVLLCSLLLRSAGLDWYEQGDVWARVHDERPTTPEAPPEQIAAMRPAVQRLLTVDASQAGRLLDGGPLASIASWAGAFEQSGQALKDLASGGTLTRGLRAVLAHHVIFHWNRLGIPYPAQCALARTARDAILDAQPQ